MRKKQKGSFTIEATIWIPIIFCMAFSILKEGIKFYSRSVNCEISEELKDWDCMSRFYEVWTLKEIGEGEESE